MFRQKTFVKKTKLGVKKVVGEHYLRDDLPCGIEGCKRCNVTNSTPQQLLHLAPKGTTQLLILDTNIILHQLDLLEAYDVDGCMPPHLFRNIILLHTVADEVRHRDVQRSDRLKRLQHRHTAMIQFSNEHCRATFTEQRTGESPNDRNDRAIRLCASYYKAHIDQHVTLNAEQQVEVIVLTDDRASREFGVAESVRCLSVSEYIRPHVAAFPKLRELLAQTSREAQQQSTTKSNATDSQSAGGDQNTKPTANGKSSFRYPEHLSASEIASGLASGALKQGTFKVNREYFGEASVRLRGTDTTVLLPDPMHMNRAIDGDLVVVQLLDASQWRKPSQRLQPTMEEKSITQVQQQPHSSDKGGDDAEDERSNGDEFDALDQVTSSTSGGDAKSSGQMPTGRVVGIAERHWRAYCGSLSDDASPQRRNNLFISVNRRIPAIRVATHQVTQLMDKRILVQIDSWPADSKHPLGHYVQTLGLIGDKEVETKVLLIEHDIATAAWSQSVLDCLPKDTHAIDPRHTVGRADFRSIQVMSIDPPGCTDIDDALHVRRLTNGNYEVGVHIADVSHYVRPDTAIDREACNRSTSVYLVDRRIDMLPSLLSTNLCSLKEGVDRLTFSVLWEMTPQVQIVNTQFMKGVIRSKHAFTYSQAQERIDDTKSQDDVTLACQQLNRFAKVLKQRRLDAGALQLASSEVKFSLDKENDNAPLDVELYQLKEANSLVEEFMLLANISVAQRILKAFPTFALLRRHPQPAPAMFEPLIRLAECTGQSMDVSSSKSLADSLDACVMPGQPFFNKLMRMMATRCMSQALYFSSGDCETAEHRHYGLATACYTHFTSPIRRLSDIIVHRLLAACLNIDPLPQTIQDAESMRTLSDGMNHRHRMAQLVSRASQELYTLLYFDERTEVAEGVIIGVKQDGLRIMVPAYGIENTIKIGSAQDKPEAKDKTSAVTQSNPEAEWAFDEQNFTLTSPDGATQYRIFQPLRVTISVQKGANRRKWLRLDLATEQQEAKAAATDSKAKKTKASLELIEPAAKRAKQAAQ